MKVLAPRVTCVVASHMKPYLRDSLESVLDQTRLDVQIIVVDSGQWHREENPHTHEMGRIYRDFKDHPLIEWYSTGENGDLRSHFCPISWATNQVIRAGLIRGRYVCTFYDDDRYEPTYFERMAGFLDENPGYRAVWCSQQRARLESWGEHIIGGISASHTLYPGMLDQRVDGTQIMFRRDVLDEIGDPWLPESALDADCRHSDGVFFERLAKVVQVIPNIDEVLVTHRFTPLSTYSPI